jgi:2-aminoethylphosphonate-pyruvate transaminase
MLLLNPGPVTLTERVRRSLLQPDLCHRESEFFDMQDEARRRLLSVYELDPAQWTAVLLTGSGTAAVESMIAALVPTAGRLLTIENGVYGERIAQICAQYGIGHERIVGASTTCRRSARCAGRVDCSCSSMASAASAQRHSTSTMPVWRRSPPPRTSACTVYRGPPS